MLQRDWEQAMERKKKGIERRYEETKVALDELFSSPLLGKGEENSEC